MAQTMFLTSSVSSQALDLKRKQQPLVDMLKPKPFYQVLLPSIPSHSSPSFHAATTIALFKSKPKAAPAKKVNVR